MSSSGTDAIIEVISSAFERLCEELEPEELKLMRHCLYDEIDNSITGQSLLHVSRLLTLVISTLQVNSVRKVSGGYALPIIDIILFLK